MRDRILNVLIVFTAILWAAWVVMWSAAGLNGTRPMPLMALPILAAAALVGWFLFAMFRAGKRASG